MTEAEWLASSDPADMLEWATGPLAVYPPHTGTPNKLSAPSDRKLRLLACAMLRRFQGVMAPEAAARLDAAEAYADGTGPEPGDWPARLTNGGETVTLDPLVTLGLWNNITLERHDAEAACLLREIVGDPFHPLAFEGDYLHDPEVQSVIVGSVRARGEDPNRGNARRQLLPDAIRTPEVVRLSEMAYQERPGRRCERCAGSKWVNPGCRCPACHGTGRVEDGTLDPGRLAVLSDALEENGCRSVESERSELVYQLDGCFCDDGRGLPECEKCTMARVRMKELVFKPCLLAHLRSTGPHVRGCHVIDLLTGRT